MNTKAVHSKLKKQLLNPYTPTEKKLTEDVLRLWASHDDCEKLIAPKLYRLCKSLNSRGKAGQGFSNWLKENRRSRATAYRWIRTYAEHTKRPLPFTPTLSRVKQSAAVPTKLVTDPFTELKIASSDLLNRVEKEGRKVVVQKFIEWLIAEYVEVANAN